MIKKKEEEKDVKPKETEEEVKLKEKDKEIAHLTERCQALTGALVYLRDNVVHGNERVVEHINRSIGG